jgi:hypothetical protein
MHGGMTETEIRNISGRAVTVAFTSVSAESIITVSKVLCRAIVIPVYQQRFPIAVLYYKL